MSDHPAQDDYAAEHVVLPITYVRWKPGEDRVTKVFPHLPADHPTAPLPCLGCGMPLGTGGPVALLCIGPGDDADARVRAVEGRWGTYRAVALHAACAGAGHAEVAR